jgi:hypothetical protein
MEGDNTGRPMVRICLRKGDESVAVAVPEYREISDDSFKKTTKNLLEGSAARAMGVAPGSTVGFEVEVRYGGFSEELFEPKAVFGSEGEASYEDLADIMQGLWRQLEELAWSRFQKELTNLDLPIPERMVVDPSEDPIEV